MNKTDYDYLIIALHEKLNRTIVSIYHPDYEARIKAAQKIRRDIKRLERERKANTIYVPINYGELIELSRSGREKIAVYPYPDNPYDTRYTRKLARQLTQFNVAWGKLTG